MVYLLLQVLIGPFWVYISLLLNIFQMKHFIQFLIGDLCIEDMHFSMFDISYI